MNQHRGDVELLHFRERPTLRGGGVDQLPGIGKGPAGADRALLEAQGASAEASAELLTFTGTHALGPNENALNQTSEALNKASNAAHQLVAALAALASARAGLARAQRLLAQTEDEHGLARVTADQVHAGAKEAWEEADSAAASLGQDEKALLSSAEQLKSERDRLGAGASSATLTRTPEPLGQPPRNRLPVRFRILWALARTDQVLDLVGRRVGRADGGEVLGGGYRRERDSTGTCIR